MMLFLNLLFRVLGMTIIGAIWGGLAGFLTIKLGYFANTEAIALYFGAVIGSLFGALISTIEAMFIVYPTRNVPYKKLLLFFFKACGFYPVLVGTVPLSLLSILGLYAFSFGFFYLWPYMFLVMPVLSFLGLIIGYFRLKKIHPQYFEKQADD